MKSSIIVPAFSPNSFISGHNVLTIRSSNNFITSCVPFQFQIAFPKYSIFFIANAIADDMRSTLLATTPETFPNFSNCTMPSPRTAVRSNTLFTDIPNNLETTCKAVLSPTPRTFLTILTIVKKPFNVLYNLSTLSLDIISFLVKASNASVIFFISFAFFSGKIAL